MLTGMLVMFTLLGIFIPESPGPIAEALWFGLMIMTAYGSWWVFQRFYEEPELKPGSDKMSQLLKQTQSQSDLIIQSIADGVVVFDANGKISVINTAAASVSEWTLEEAKGIDVRAVIKLVKEDGTPMADDQDVFGEVLKSSQADSHTLRLLGRNGKSTIVSMIISPIRIPNQQETVGAVAVFRDVTLSREEENRRADFISTASHEMRTPVAAIEGYLALALNDKVSQIDTKAREYLEKAHTSTEHLGHLFQDLLTSAKAEDGRLTSHPVVVELGAYLEQLADSFRFSAEKKGLLTDLIIGSAGTPADSTVGSKVVKPLYYVYADPDRMREVITNIFDNAVKYSDTGKITVGLTGNDSVVQLSVKDTGSGIPAEDLGHLFQKFYRVDNSSTRTVGGTGLGLFICRKIVELYHGRIWVESEMGKGSVFYINLPRLSVQKATEMQAAEAAQSSPLGQTNV
jgi:PAS domain S-box-containing protein